MSHTAGLHACVEKGFDNDGMKKSELGKSNPYIKENLQLTRRFHFEASISLSRVNQKNCMGKGR